MTLDDLAPVHSWKRTVLGLAVVLPMSLAVPASAASVSAGGPYTGAEGQHVAIHGTASGAAGYRWSAKRAPGGQQDRATCRFGDATSLSTDVWCNDDGLFDLRLTSSDGTTSTARLTLTNVSPTLTWVTPPNGTAVARHAQVQLSAGYRDPGRIDPHKYVIRWGDGKTSRAPTRERRNGSGEISGTHSYAHAGIRTVTVSILDSHGARDHATRMLKVLTGAPCPRVTGGGRLPGHRYSHFSLWGHCGSSGALGAERLWLPGSGQFASTSLTLLRGHDRNATMSGTGRWRPAFAHTWQPGYRYKTSMLDRGARHDWIRVSVRTPAGDSVLHVVGTLVAGGIVIRH